MYQKEPGFFAKLIGSIWDFEIYPLVIRQSVGKAVLYLFLFTLLLTAVISVPSTISSYLFYREFNEEVEKLPEFVIEDGRLTFSGAMPYYAIDDPASNNEIIIDTTGATDQSVLNQYRTAILVTETRAFIKDEDGDITTVEFRYLPTITQANLVRMFSWLMVLVLVAAFLFFWLWTFVGKLFSALIISLFARAISRFVRFHLRWKELYILSIYAITLPTIVVHLANLIPGANLGLLLFFVYYILTCMWLYKAIQTIADRNTV